MNRSPRFLQIVFLLTLFICRQNTSLYAYTEEIEAGFDEVEKAAKQILEPHGINKSKPAKRYIESDWIQDQVVRKRQLLPFTKIKGTIQQAHDRRYRITVKWEEATPYTRVMVKGNFQIKPSEFHPGMAWRPVKPRLPESTIERDFFFKVLRQIEQNRLNSSAKSG